MIKGYCEPCSAKLEREGKVIYSAAPNYLENSWFFASGQPNGAMYKALLINVEPLESKCPNSHKDFVCGNCGKNFDLVPKPKACEHPQSKLSEPYQARGLDYAWVRKCECGHVVANCTHPSEKVRPAFSLSVADHIEYYHCAACNQRVKATKWETEQA